jgi:hypothetical protein
MSVFDASRCKNVEEILVGHEEYLVASISASQARRAGMTIIRKEEEGIGHCEVVGEKSRGVRARWAKESNWVVPPRKA